jgi:DNA polymerase III delta prime subunit
MDLPLPERDRLHHSYILTGNILTLREAFARWVDNQDEKITIHQQIHTSFTIDDARQLKDIQQQKSAHPVCFVISLESITHEAQHALLKVLEEPTRDTFFFFLARDTSLFIETILSRVHIIETKSFDTQEALNLKEFLGLKKSERIERIKKITDPKKEDKISKHQTALFLNELEAFLYETGERNLRLFSSIQKMRVYAQNNGSSLKMILEFIALEIPLIKK